MKAITIKQPWAGHIVFGEKRVENRSWKTDYRGPLAIHAGSGIDRNAPLLEVLDDRAYLCGYTIGTCALVDCITEADAVIRLTRAELRWVEGPWCWILADVKPLKAPVKISGKLGLWNYT